jgi:hypothetical protein
MRRQYHSRRIGGRNLIWDVHRLIELARQYPVQQVSLSRISELDERFWFDRVPATCRAVALLASARRRAVYVLESPAYSWGLGLLDIPSLCANHHGGRGW